jgi:DNA-binding CsgD family transcriptional regulator
MKLPHVSISQFNDQLLRNNSLNKSVCDQFFQKSIEEAKSLAIGPYYWLIPDQSTMTILSASKNIGQLTLFSTEEWINKSSFFWIENMHPDDREFVASAIVIGVGIHEGLPIEKAENLRFNIYCRMLNREKIYRWVLIQFPKKMFNEEQKIISTLILTTDLSHLQVNFKRMMSLIDSSNEENIYFATQVDGQKLEPLGLNNISKREMEILQLMAKGLNSPQLAEKLYISYHTVENHKRHLRQKTNTKTSAELIDYVWRHNLI